MIFHDVSVFRLQESMKIEKKGKNSFLSLKKSNPMKMGAKWQSFPKAYFIEKDRGLLHFVGRKIDHCFLCNFVFIFLHSLQYII